MKMSSSGFEVFDKTYKTCEAVSSLADSIEDKLEEIEFKEDPIGKTLRDLFSSVSPEEPSAGEKLLDEVFDSAVGEFLLDSAPILGIASGLLGSLFSTRSESGYPAIALEGSFSVRGTMETKDMLLSGSNKARASTSLGRIQRISGGHHAHQ
jgi:hypothetical protein